MDMAVTEETFEPVGALVRRRAVDDPDHIALIDETGQSTYGDLDGVIDRASAALQRDGLGLGDVVAICASNSIAYAALYLAATNVGVVVAPLPVSATAQALQSMILDSGARLIFADTRMIETLDAVADRIPGRVISLSDEWESWLEPAGAKPRPAHIEPTDVFNIIYSSGTTGTPKGIVQPHSMRIAHVNLGASHGYDGDAVTLLSTPLYSNTTLVSFFPTLAMGGTAILMRRFDVLTFLALVEKHRVTHAMLVPIQYQRLMDHPRLADFDLRSLTTKFCTSSPFTPELKTEVLRKLPGRLLEYYGMTEGGGLCVLEAHAFPDKLHTVGQPAEGNDMRIIGDDGQELPQGSVGEIVGRSVNVMLGYHNQPELTEAAQWRNTEGQAFIRTGDIGRFDEEGFLTLLDRKKDLIISGGFNIYPSDIEEVLRTHPRVLEAAVLGVPSKQWGETPVAFVVLYSGTEADPAALMDWANQKLGKTQRVAALHVLDHLPRNAIGKILKRELRDRAQKVIE